jgi:glycosyltransferase involved in cell wall biosynthesis
VRVTIASRIFAPEPAAASFRLEALANALAEAGHDVTVLTGRLRDARAPGLDRRVRVARWPVLRDRSGVVRGYVQYLSFDVPLVLRVLLGRRADVVVVEPPPMTGAAVRIASRARRTPYVYYAGDVWTDALRSTSVPAPIVRAVGALERWVLRGAARVVAVNDGVADAIRALAADAAVDVVPNGIDTRIFTPAGAAAADGRYVVYAGTASEWQGADVFVRAMPRVLETAPDARLVLVGQGSAWAHLQRLARELDLGDAVAFHDLVPPARAAEWLRGARASLVSIVPDGGYDFALPTKIYAGLAAGAPAIFAGGADAASARLLGAADARAADLGDAVAHDPDAVAAAILRRLDAPLDDPARAGRSAWVAANASVAATGRGAAAVAVAAGSSRGER